MAARRRRSTFAAPLVITLAAVPACIVRTAPPAPNARPAGGDHRGDPVIVSNPPRPVDTADSTPPPSRPPGRPAHADTAGTAGTIDQGPPPVPPIKQTDGSTDVVQADTGSADNLRAWTVNQRTDKTCYATHPTQCPPPPATCNPPPPARMKTCPDGITPKTSVRVRELSPGECFVVHDAPACPPGVSCNPPRPVEIDCPPY